MTISLISSSHVIAYLGIGSGTDTTGLSQICAGLSDAVKKWCRWEITEKAYILYLPRVTDANGIQVPTANLWSDRRSPLGNRNRLFLPLMYVTAVTDVWEDMQARAGQGATDFASTTKLTEGDNYYLEPDHGETSTGVGGFLVRVGQNFPSIPGSIKVSCTAGLKETDLEDPHYGLRFRLTQRACELFLARKRIASAINTGVGGGDTSGLLAGEKLGDYGATFRDPLSTPSGFDNKGGGMLGEGLEEFLQDSGYVLCNVSV